MINQTNRKKINQKNKKGAEKKSAPNNKKQRNNGYSFDDEIIIGIPRRQETTKKYPSKKNKSYSKPKKKKVKKLSEQQIKRRKIIFKIVRWTSLIVCIIGITIYILMSPLFSVRKITVSTDGKLTDQEIISLAAINLNENTFKFTKKQIVNNIKENAYVDEVIFERKLPNEVQITIKERVPALMITYGNAYVYLNNQGYMLEISKEYQDLQILKGIKTSNEEIEVGKRLCNEDLEKLTTVLKIMEIAKNEEILDLITAIDISDSTNYKLIMEKEEKYVYLGDCSMLEERMLWVKTIMNNEKDIPGEIFVNMNLNIENPFFRERV